MSTTARQMDAQFRIQRRNEPGALAAVRALGPNHRLVNAGTLAKARTLREALLAWRWKLLIRDGQVTHIHFIGEALGESELLLQTIAPYVEPGSYIQMMNWDNHIWRWVFDGTAVQRVEGQVIFPEPFPSGPPGAPSHQVLSSS